MNNINFKWKALLYTFFIGMSITINAQETAKEEPLEKLNIEDCYLWSQENFPLIKQMDIIDKTTQYSLSNANIGNLPQINLNGQATYQSNVTSIPIDLPGLDIPTVDKDQYKIYAEVYQPLTNFSNVKNKKKEIALNGEIEKQKVAVDLYQVNERINQIFFGVLIIKEKIVQFEIIKSDIDSTSKKLEAAIANGTATLTDKRLLDVEKIALKQQIEENKSNQLAYLKILSILTGKNISESTILEKPEIQEITTDINRPELKLFNIQRESIDIQQKKLNNKLIPNVGLFAQGGYGKPGLNFLSSEFEFYYIGGLKFNWNLSNFYNLKNTKNIIKLSNEKIASQRETFLLNTKLTQMQQSAEMLKYKNLYKTDLEIINIREEILRTAKVQLENGLITTIDYVKFLNDVSKAKQTQLLHETQLLLALYNLKITTGN